MRSSLLVLLALLTFYVTALTAQQQNESKSVPITTPSISYFGVPQPSTEFSVKQLCEEIGNKLGSVSVDDCHRQSLKPTGKHSKLGRSIASKEYRPIGDKIPLGRVMIIGGIHGDEYSSVSIVFKWMDILNQHHSGLFHWQVTPLMNPDGLLRKKSQRQNSNGVDLNRNFPTEDWQRLAKKYWEKRTYRNKRRFPGHQAMSELETQWLVEEINTFKPDIIVSVHAPYHLVDYDGPSEAPKKIGDLYLHQLGVYPGSLGNYGGLDLNIPVVTIELPSAGIMPSQENINLMWRDLVRWLIKERKKHAHQLSLDADKHIASATN